MTVDRVSGIDADMLSTETQILLANLARAGGSIEFAEDEIPYSTQCLDEARGARLVCESDDGGWGVTVRLSLTRRGLAHMSMPAPKTIIETVMATALNAAATVRRLVA